MKLYDFFADPDLNRLRQQMEADELGDFHLFDPHKQLTYQEREALELGQLSIHSNDLRVLKDKTLAFKNSRVWVLHEEHLHLASCRLVQRLRHQPKDLLCGTAETYGKIPVCLDCLVALQYQGMDARRARRGDLAEQITEEFSLAEFKDHFPFYPI